MANDKDKDKDKVQTDIGFLPSTVADRERRRAVIERIRDNMKKNTDT